MAKLNDESLSVINEALNGLFDLFGQDEAAPLCRSLHLAAHLKQFIPVFRTRIRQHANRDPELASMLEESQENAVAFLGYLQSI